MRDANRGVSEVVSFVLVFSLITLMVGTVYVTGFSGLQGARDHEQVNNAQRAFDVLADNFADLADTGAPRRSTSLKLTNAHLSFGDPVTINVTLGPNAHIVRSTRPIVYTADSGGQVSFVNGAVVRSSSSGSVMVDGPGFVFGNTAFITLLKLRPYGQQSVGGTAQVHVAGARAVRNIYRFPTTGGNATLNVTSTHPKAWTNYLSSAADVGACTTYPVTGSSMSKVSCTVDTDHVVVRVVEIDVTFE